MGRPQTAVACRSGVFRCNTGNLHIRLDDQIAGTPVLPFRWCLSMKLDAMLYRLHSQLEQEKEEKKKKERKGSLAMTVWRSASCAVRRLEAACRCRRRPFTTSSSYASYDPQRRDAIVDLLNYDSDHPDAVDKIEQDVRVSGWVRSVRKQKQVAFAHIGDGTTARPLQAVLKPEQAAK